MRYHVNMRWRGGIDCQVAVYDDASDALAKCRQLNGINIGVNARPLDVQWFALVLTGPHTEYFQREVYPSQLKRILAELRPALHDFAQYYIIGTWRDHVQTSPPPPYTDDDLVRIAEIQYNVPKGAWQ